MLVVAAGGCHRGEKSTPADTTPVVRVASPVVRKVTDYAWFTGRTEAVQSVNVQSRVTGYLNSIDFEPGSDVKANQQLFLIDPRPYQAELDRANGQVLLAEARLKLAKADYARALALAQTPGAISQQDVDKYAAGQSEAEAELFASKANSESARLNVEFTRVISPIAGVVGRNLLTIGNLVTRDATLLTTVVSEDPMYAYFDIDDHTLLRIQRLAQEGKVKRTSDKAIFPVEMGLSDEGDRYPYRGEIDFINNRMDPSTGTLQMRGVFANPVLNTKNLRLLASGQFVRIRLPIGEPHDALLVHRESIGTDQGKKYLLAVNDQDNVEYRPIELGPEQPGGLQVVAPVAMVRIADGLRPAAEGTPADQTAPSITVQDRVVVGGLQKVRPGVRVKTRPVEEDPAAPVAVGASPGTTTSQKPPEKE
jgi:membrane fusion protein, multidrug efflux system